MKKKIGFDFEPVKARKKIFHRQRFNRPVQSRTCYCVYITRVHCGRTRHNKRSGTNDYNLFVCECIYDRTFFYRKHFAKWCRCPLIELNLLLKFDQSAVCNHAPLAELVSAQSCWSVFFFVAWRRFEMWGRFRFFFSWISFSF